MECNYCKHKETKLCNEIVELSITLVKIKTRILKEVFRKSMLIFILHLRRGEAFCDHNVTIVICIVKFRAKRF